MILKQIHGQWVLRLFLCLWVAGCQFVPGTQRSQLRILPLADEMRIGLNAWNTTLKGMDLISQGPEYDRVQSVGRRVAVAAEALYPEPSKHFEWEFVLVDDPKTVNAWALPGGKSAVYSGLLPFTKDDASLAIVMGHEVAHAIAGHGAERMSQNLLFGLGLSTVDAALGGKVEKGAMTAERHDSLMQALSGAGTLGVLLPYSRTHESEADHLGLFIAAAAGYDPRAAIGLWRRMTQSNEAPPEFLSTHPSEETRIQKLQALMPEALSFYKQSKHADH